MSAPICSPNTGHSASFQEAMTIEIGYRASADLLIDQDDFVWKAIFYGETNAEPTPDQSEAPPAEVGAEASKLIHLAVKEATAPLPLAKLAAILLATIEGLDASIRAIGKLMAAMLHVHAEIQQGPPVAWRTGYGQDWSAIRWAEPSVFGPASE